MIRLIHEAGTLLVTNAKLLSTYTLSWLSLTIGFQNESVCVSVVQIFTQVLDSILVYATWIIHKSGIHVDCHRDIWMCVFLRVIDRNLAKLGFSYSQGSSGVSLRM